MTDESKTNKQLIDELALLRIRIAELDKLNAEKENMIDTLRQSEKRFRELFERSHEWFYLHDFEGKMIDASQAILDRLGYNRQDISHLDFISLLDRDQLTKATKAIGEIKRFGFSREIYEFKLRSKDGEVVNVEVSGTVVERHGQPYAILGIARDITKHSRTIDKLRRAMGAIIQAMAVAVEEKDPYTAGHQERVADLARSLATVLSLPKDQIEGIRMASTIHDLGKISIPSEILNKTAKFTELDFAMIKNHPQAGYDIVKNIEFPWPISRIILEHHERMDGSGYPRGLKGDDILLEARILAVADVVEAMASHRPYRAALGIDAALDEIYDNKAVLYDPKVVDACLWLFRMNGYKLKD